MTTCKGLTVVSHEDLTKAVRNWEVCNNLYHKIKADSLKYAQEKFNKLPKFKKFYLKYTKCDWLAFIPCVTIYNHGEEYLIKYMRETEGGIYVKLDKLNAYFHSYILQGIVAKECKNHSMYGGVHYLNDHQVLFVSKFKDMEV